MHQIRIPIGSEGGYSYEQFAAYCKHFSCSLKKKKRGDIDWVIESEDNTNFFWLGMNLTLRSTSNLTVTPAEKYLQ